MKRSVLMTAVLLLSLSPPALAEEKYEYGPAPDWDRYKELGEAALRAKLSDPANYTIEWSTGYMQGGWRHRGRFAGYLACGKIRDQAQVKDRSPLTNFVVVIDQDLVKTVDISTRESNSLVNVMCENLIGRGLLPPAHLMQASPDLTVASLGLKIRPMSQGAYIIEVGTASPAQRVGLAPGMVITRANAIELGGMGSAMTKVLGSDVPALVVEIATGERFDVKRAP